MMTSSEMPDASAIAHEDRPTGGRSRTIVDGHEAQMTFSRASPTLIVIDHTSVPYGPRGRSVGEKLVERTVANARLEGFRRPFESSRFERHPPWRDVLSA